MYNFFVPFMLLICCECTMKINFLLVVFRNDRRMALIQMGSTEEAIAALIVSTMKENIFIFIVYFVALGQHTCSRAYLHVL